MASPMVMRRPITGSPMNDQNGAFGRLHRGNHFDIF